MYLYHWRIPRLKEHDNIEGNPDLVKSAFDISCFVFLRIAHSNEKGLKEFSNSPFTMSAARECRIHCRIHQDASYVETSLPESKDARSGYGQPQSS